MLIKKKIELEWNVSSAQLWLSFQQKFAFLNYKDLQKQRKYTVKIAEEQKTQIRQIQGTYIELQNLQVILKIGTMLLYYNIKSQMNVNVNIKSEKTKCLKLNNFSNFYLSQTCMSRQKQDSKHQPSQNNDKINELDKKTHRRSKTDHGRTISDTSLTEKHHNFEIKRGKQSKKNNGVFKCQTLTLIPKSFSQKSHVVKSCTSKSRQKSKNSKKLLNLNSQVIKIKKSNNPQEKYLSQSLMLNNLKQKFKKPANNKSLNQKKTVQKTIKLNLPQIQNIFQKSHKFKVNKQTKQQLKLKYLIQNDLKLQQLKQLIIKRIKKKSKTNEKEVEDQIMHIFTKDKYNHNSKNLQKCSKEYYQDFKNKDQLLINFVNSQANLNLNHLNQFYQQTDEQESVIQTSRTFKNIQGELQVNRKIIQDKKRENLKFLSMIQKSHEIINILLPFLETGLQLKIKQQRMLKIFHQQNQKNSKLIKFANLMALKGIDVQNQLKNFL